MQEAQGDTVDSALHRTERAGVWPELKTCGHQLESLISCSFVGHGAAVP